MNTFGKFVLTLTGGVAIAAIEKVVNGGVKEKENENEKSCTAVTLSHGDAIKAIYDNVTYSSTRSRLIGKIPVNAPADYYYAVIVAMENSSYDCDRIKAVDDINNAYGL